MEISSQLNAICGPVALVAWTAVYFLMIKRGIQDRSYGMPIAALAVDISTELYFTFHGAPEARPVFGPWFLINLGVLYTVFRYGREDFDWPLLRRWFHPIVVAMLLAAAFLVFNLAQAFGDTTGGLTASFGMLVYSVLLPVMLIRRDSLDGQSLYIALLILVGDAAGVVTTLYSQAHVDTVAPTSWLVAAYTVGILLHVLYVGLVWWVARRDGIDPWRRL